MVSRDSDHQYGNCDQDKRQHDDDDDKNAKQIIVEDEAVIVNVFSENW